MKIIHWEYNDLGTLSAAANNEDIELRIDKLRANDGNYIGICVRWRFRLYVGDKDLFLSCIGEGTNNPDLKTLTTSNLKQIVGESFEQFNQEVQDRLNPENASIQMHYDLSEEKVYELLSELSQQ